jgi:hypothetical protein
MNSCLFRRHDRIATVLVYVAFAALFLETFRSTRGFGLGELLH